MILEPKKRKSTFPPSIFHEVMGPDAMTLVFFFFLIYFILFFNFIILYWFCHISTWIHHRYTRVPHPELSSLLPPRTIPLGRPSAPVPSIQYRALNNDWVIIHCMYVAHILNPFICWWILRLIPYLGCCKKCFSEHCCACTLSNHIFLQIYA